MQKITVFGESESQITDEKLALLRVALQKEFNIQVMEIDLEKVDSVEENK